MVSGVPYDHSLPHLEPHASKQMLSQLLRIPRHWQDLETFLRTSEGGSVPTWVLYWSALDRCTGAQIPLSCARPPLGSQSEGLSTGMITPSFCNRWSLALTDCLRVAGTCLAERAAGETIESTLILTGPSSIPSFDLKTSGNMSMYSSLDLRFDCTLATLTKRTLCTVIMQLHVLHSGWPKYGCQLGRHNVKDGVMCHLRVVDTNLDLSESSMGGYIPHNEHTSWGTSFNLSTSTSWALMRLVSALVSRRKVLNLRNRAVCISEDFDAASCTVQWSSQSSFQRANSCLMPDPTSSSPGGLTPGTWGCCIL